MHTLYLRTQFMVLISMDNKHCISLKHTMQQSSLESLPEDQDDFIVRPAKCDVEPKRTEAKTEKQLEEVLKRLQINESVINDVGIMVNHNTTAIRQITNSFLGTMTSPETNGSPDDSGDHNEEDMTQLTNQDICHACPNCVFLRNKYAQLQHDFGVLVRENERIKTEFTKDFEMISECLIQQNEKIEQVGWEMKYMENNAS